MDQGSIRTLRRVRAVLILRGSTLARLADAVGVSRQHLADVFAGVANVSQSVRIRLEMELGDAFAVIQRDDLDVLAARRR